jgi:hypothetical protein
MTTQPQRALVVRKTKAMVAAEVARATGRAWEQPLLRRLSTPTLHALARDTIPGWSPAEHHQAD